MAQLIISCFFIFLIFFPTVVIITASKDKKLINKKLKSYNNNKTPILTYYYPKSGVQVSDKLRVNDIVDQYRNFTSYTDTTYQNVLGHAIAIGTRDTVFLTLDQTHFLSGGCIMSKIRLINLPNEPVKFDKNGFYTPGNYIFPIVDGTGIYLGVRGYIDFTINAADMGRSVSIYIDDHIKI